MEILLLRHGQTKGNLEKRYIGRTDEPLLESARDSLRESPYREFHPEIVYVSPMLRCRETAEILFFVPETDDIAGMQGADCSSDGNARNGLGENMLHMHSSRRMICHDGLREMDFGIFENKNYEELKDEPAYQEWLDSGGKFAFPGGENGNAFRVRCRKAFEECLEDAKEAGFRRIAFVVHGGTIMSIMEEYGTPKGDFYRWQVKNGKGYLCVVTDGGEDIILSLKK